jgi:hypothetical protein
MDRDRDEEDEERAPDRAPDGQRGRAPGRDDEDDRRPATPWRFDDWAAL